MIDWMINIEIRVPIIKLLGGKSIYRAIDNPVMTEETEMATEVSTKDLNEETHFLAVNTGITKRAPINNPPTVFIPIQTTIARSQKYKSSINRGVLLKGIW